MKSYLLPGAAAIALAALPWLNPFTLGPSAAAIPWFVSAAAALALYMLSVRSGHVRVHPALIGCCALVVAWASLTHLGSNDGIPALAAGLVLMLLMAGAVGDEAIGRGVLQGLLVASLLSAVAGLVQYLGLSDAFTPLVNYAPPGEAYGNLRQPNQFATLCWLGFAVVLWGTPRVPSRLAVPASALLAAAAACSVSRTGMLQGLCLVAMCIVWPSPSRRQNVRLCAVAVAAYLAATFLLPMLLAHLTGMPPSRLLWSRLSSSYGCNSRAILWSNVLSLIAERPWVGWGWGELDYAHFTTLYSGPRFCEILDNAHNLPLHMAVELGVPFAVLIGGGALAWGLRQRPWREQDSRRQVAWAIVLIILLHNMLEYPLWYGPFQIVFGAALGWLLMCAELPACNLARARATGATVATVLLCLGAYAAWDYWRVSQVYLPPQERREAWRSDPLRDALHSRLFAQQARFAELTLATVDRRNADSMAALAQEMLHYSPEPRVVERLIEAETYLGKEREALHVLARFRAAYPKDYEAWLRAKGIAHAEVPPASGLNEAP